MILKKKGSRVFLVNLFADFVLTKIKKTESTVIKIVDCGQFYVVKGQTSSKEVLNLSDLTLEFKTEFKEFVKESRLIHTIDLIQYDYKFIKDLEIGFTYHDSENCSYTQKQIDKWNNSEYSVDSFLNSISDEEMIITSEFPHGFSFDRGRLLYYYGKKIIYSIPPNYPFKTLTLELSNIKNFHDVINFQVFDEKSESYDEFLESSIRDVFSFDMSELKNEMEKVEITQELLEPLDEFEYLKTPIKNFIII